MSATTRLGGSTTRRNPSRLASAVVAVVLMATVGLVRPAAVAGSAVCPSPPDTLAGLMSPDAVATGPLTDQFRPVYGVYAEAAAGCWPGTEFRVAGFVATPEGLGGAAPFSIEPGWMVSRAHFLATTDAVGPEGGPVGPFFPVAVPPSLEAQVSALDQRWVRVSGHFDDAIANTCTVTPASPDPGTIPTAEQAIEICRTSFVLTAVAPLTLPPTDVASPIPPAGSGLEWFAVLLAIAAVSSLRLALSRGPRPARDWRP